jgi:hypothetical protein
MISIILIFNSNVVVQHSWFVIGQCCNFHGINGVHLSHSRQVAHVYYQLFNSKMTILQVIIDHVYIVYQINNIKNKNKAKIPHLRNTQIHDDSLSGFGTVTSIKGGGVKLDLLAQTFERVIRQCCNFHSINSTVETS